MLSSLLATLSVAVVGRFAFSKNSYFSSFPFKSLFSSFSFIPNKFLLPIIFT